jgi:hypothetical protein
MISMAPLDCTYQNKWEMRMLNFMPACLHGGVKLSPSAVVSSLSAVVAPVVAAAVGNAYPMKKKRYCCNIFGL